MAVLLLLASQPAMAGLFPAGSTLILLNGVPGDVESESAYREQLQNWLEIAAAENVKRLFLLCDNPESLGFRATPQAKMVKADRQHFLEVSQALAGTTNPLVVIAWGHGGSTGPTAVFHVRGPRLTPADFAKLAQQANAPESRWILIFRGSGAFARELAGPHRQVLSSDLDSPFNSDPIGMGVLLKIARAKPNLEFGQFAEEFGRETTAWYAERNLARTEEPALWVGEGAGRRLADSGKTAESGKAAKASSPGPPTTAEAKDTKTADTNAPQALAEMSPAWKEIKKVEPQKYPEADGVVLKQSVSCVIGSNPALAIDQEEFIQILTPEGKQFGDFDVAYAPPYEEVEFLDCEVLRPDGKLLRLDPESIGEKGEQTPGQYEVGRRRFFSLPGVVPGAVLHVRYRTQWKEFPLPHVSLELPLGHELPALDSTVQVTVPKDSPFHFGFERVVPPDPAIQQTSYGTRYVWRLHDLPAYRTEVLAPPRHRPRLMVSTFADWPAFAQWYERISQLTSEITPEISARAAELTQDAKSDRDKLVALYNYVTGLRYVAVPMGVNSFRPHAAANVLKNQYGDCKDKANLLNALLRASGIQAHLVLVPRFGEAPESVPGLAFNHAISRVDLGKETIWVDSTDDICRFGLLPPGDPGRNVLVIDGHSRALTHLPLPDPKDHRLEISGQLNCSDPAQDPPIDLKAVAFGYPDYELRNMARETKEHRSLPLLGARFRPVAGSFALDKQRATAVSALDKDFSWEAEGAGIGLVSRASRNWVLRSPFWLPKEWDLALGTRHMPLFLNQGYPLTLEESFELALPGKAAGVALPAVCENSQGPLRWRVEWTRISDDKLHARLRAELAKGELSVAETALFQQQLRALLGGLAAEATFSSGR